MEEKSPVFIKIDEYRTVLDTVDNLKKQVVEVKKTIEKINSLRLDEEQELNSWSEKITDIEKKLALVDKTLFEPEQ